MATLTFDGDASSLLEAVERSRRAVDRLEAEVAAKKFPLGSKESDKLAEQLDRARKNAAKLGAELDKMRTPVSRWDSNVRAAEAAGRIFGGRLGEITGVMGDFSDVVENGLSPTGAIALAITGVGVAAIGAVAGTVALTRAAIDLANETGQMNGDLRQSELAMGAVSYAASGLTIELGTRTAPAVSSMSYALVGLIEAAGDTVDAIGNNTPDGLGTVLTAQYALTYPKTALAVYALAKAYEMLEEKGRDAARAQPAPLPTPKDLGMESAEAMALRIRQRKKVLDEQAATEARRSADAAAAEAKRAAEQEQRELEAFQFKELGTREEAMWQAHQFSMNLQNQRREEAFRTAEEQRKLDEQAVEDARTAAEQVARAWESSYSLQREAAFGSINSAIGLISDLVSENREAAIAMFAVRQAAAIAETVVNTQVAAARAVAELGPIAGPPAAAAIQAAGAVSVGVIAAQSVFEGVNTFGGAQQAQVPPTINATLVVEGQPIRNGVRTRSTRVGQR